jgi:hypothetical protein
MLHYSDLFLIIDKKDKYGNTEPFSIKYVQADKNRRTGGKEVYFPAGVKCGGIASDDKKDKGSAGTGNTKATVSPDHFGNDTINIQLLPSKMIKKVHLRLILEINNEPVYW